MEEVWNSEDGALQFTPRLYLNDVWSFNMLVKDFEKTKDYENFVACFFSQRTLAEREDGKFWTFHLLFICIEFFDPASAIHF